MDCLKSAGGLEGVLGVANAVVPASSVAITADTNADERTVVNAVADDMVLPFSRFSHALYMGTDLSRI